MAKKKYVLWVVHTDLNAREIIEDREMAHLHINAVMRSMREAHKAGIPIFYEAKRSGFKEGFLDMAKSKGIKEINQMPFFEDKDRDFNLREGKKAADALLKLVRKKGIRDFAVLLCGHYLGDCLKERAVALKNIGIRPLLVGGLATVLLGRGITLKEVRKFYGKKGLVLIEEIKDLQ